MKLNIESDSGRRVAVYGASDYQINDDGKITVFFPPNSGQEEREFPGTVKAAIDHSAMDDSALEEQVEFDRRKLDTVVIVPSDKYSRLRQYV